jgi:EamA domain-containing membrane protein RarD
LAAYHLFEIGSAASQLAIVLASAAIITGVTLLVYMAGALGIVGIGFGAIAWLAPTMLHL